MEKVTAAWAIPKQQAAPGDRGERSHGLGVQAAITFILGHGGDDGLAAFLTAIRAMAAAVAAAIPPKGAREDAWSRAVQNRHKKPARVRG